MSIIITIKAKINKNKFFIRFWPAIKNLPDWLQISIYFFVGYTLLACFTDKILSNGKVILSSILMSIYYIPMLIFLSYLLERESDDSGPKYHKMSISFSYFLTL